MALDVILLDDRRHAVVVLSGTCEDVDPTVLASGLRVATRCHTVVDVRQVSGVSPDLARALLCALGRAIDHRRTLRVVVRDEQQRARLAAVGLAGLVPMHTSIGEATDAVEAILGDRSHAARRLTSARM